MTDEQRQRLSALLDGEGSHQDQQRAITDALDQPELRACWERYATIGRLLRGEPISLAARGIAPRVAALIANDPDVPQVPAPTRGAEVVTLLRRNGGPRPARRPPSAPARPLIGLALAAGVALLAVVVGPRLLWPDQTGGPALALAPSATPPAVIDRWRVGDAVLTPVAAIDQPQINRLLLRHQERSGGLSGVMPYVTVVGHGGVR